MNDLSHCWSYTALVNSSCWLNIDIHTKKKKEKKKKRERQGYGCRRTQSHRGKTPLSLFFFITQMQIKDIHQVCDSPQQITNCQLNHQLAQLRVAVALLKTGCWLASWSVCVCVCVCVYLWVHFVQLLIWSSHSCEEIFFHQTLLDLTKSHK